MRKIADTQNTVNTADTKNSANTRNTANKMSLANTRNTVDTNNSANTRKTADTHLANTCKEHRRHPELRGKHKGHSRHTQLDKHKKNSGLTKLS